MWKIRSKTCSYALSEELLALRNMQRKIGSEKAQKKRESVGPQVQNRGGQCLGGGRGHCTKKWQQLRPTLDRRLDRPLLAPDLGRETGDWQKEFWPLASWGQTDGRPAAQPPLSIFATQQRETQNAFKWIAAWHFCSASNLSFCNHDTNMNQAKRYSWKINWKFILRISPILHVWSGGGRPVFLPHCCEPKPFLPGGSTAPGRGKTQYNFLSNTEHTNTFFTA